MLGGWFAKKSQTTLKSEIDKATDVTELSPGATDPAPDAKPEGGDQEKPSSDGARRASRARGSTGPGSASPPSGPGGKE